MTEVPPHDLSAEQALLGSMILDRSALEAISQLFPDDFYRPAHAAIFSAICALVAQGHAVDHLTLADRLTTDGELERSGGKPYLLDITSAVPTARNWRRYADIVKQASTRRQVIEAGHRMGLLAHDADDPDELLAESEKLVSSIADRHVTGSSRALSVSAIYGALDLSKRVECFTSELLPGVFLQRGTLTFLGARPSVGKSAFAGQLADEFGSRHVRVRIYTYEMGREQYTRRFIQRRTGYGLSEQLTGMDARQIGHTNESMSGDWGDFVEIDDSNPPLPELCRQIRRFASQGGTLVIIDHLHILAGRERRELEAATRALKLAADDSRLNGDVRDRRPVVVCLAQFHRSELRDDGSVRPPSMQSFRESGSIEEDADVAVLLHKYDEKLDTKARDGLERSGYILEFDRQRGVEPYKSLAHVEIAKNREGKCGRYPAWFHGPTQSWSFLDRKERP